MFSMDFLEQEIIFVLESIQDRYSSKKASFELCNIAGGYQFLTKPEYQASVNILLKQN